MGSLFRHINIVRELLMNFASTRVKSICLTLQPQTTTNQSCRCGYEEIPYSSSYFQLFAIDKHCNQLLSWPDNAQG